MVYGEQGCLLSVERGERMSRYIDADAFIEENDGAENSGWTLKELVDNFPPADVVEVVHGEWILHDKGLHTEFCTCSKCNSIVESDEAWNFCPNCGARMVEE